MLTHPLFLLLVSALLTGLFLPWFTRQWQERKQALDLKTSLVSEMSESVTSLITRIGAVRVYRSWLPGPDARDQDPSGAEQIQAKYSEAFDEMNEGYFTFERTSSGITAKLRVFFPTSDIERRWRELAGLVSGVYALEGTYGADRRARSQLEIRKRLIAQTPDLDIPEDWGEDDEKWQSVKTALLDIHNDVVGDILREPVRPPRTRRAKIGRR